MVAVTPLVTGPESGVASPVMSSAVVPAGRVSAALERMREAALELSSACSFAADHDDLVAAVGAVPAVSAAVDAALGLVGDAARVRCTAQREGFRRVDQMMLSASNGSGAEVRARGRRAEWLGDFCEFADAHQAGVLTVAHVEKLRRALDGPRTRFLLRRDQAMIVDAASTCDFVGFEKFCDYWLIAADPDGAEPKEQLERTHFTARRRSDGMVKVAGLLDPLSGQTFLTAWEREVQKLALEETQAETGDDNSPVAGDPRRHGRRGARALLNLITRGAARADGTHSEPLVHIVMSLEVAKDTMRRLAEQATTPHALTDRSPLPVDHHDVDGRCELIDGTAVHPFLVASVLGIAALQRTVMDATGRPLSTSYATHAFPKWLRHLVLLRSRGRCEATACDAPFPWLQLDHKHPFSRGGPTAYDNAQALCRPHNLAKGASV